MPQTTDFADVLAIRLGFGLGPDPAAADAAAMLASVDAARAGDGWTVPRAGEAHRQFAKSRRDRDAGTISADEYKRISHELTALNRGVLRRRIARAVGAPAGFGERLVQFWTDHFTTVAPNLPQQMMAAAFVDEAIRPNLNGRFADLLFAADTHTMMLVYLNQVNSFGPGSVFVRKRPEKRLGLNENLAREAIELHSLGVGAAYTQADVRELAELLTGLSADNRKGTRYIAQAAEPGADVVLGESYGGPGTSGMDEIRRAMTDLAGHPATAAHLSRKLAVHFVADDPPDALVADLTDAWRGSGGDLATVYGVLVRHPALMAGFRHKARQPFDFIAASLRALGLGEAGVMALDSQRVQQALAYPLTLMGQPWNRARGPDGWPDRAEDWITPQMLSARIGWSLRQPARLVDPLPDPRAFLATALGSTASEPLARAVPRAESAREGVAIVLASSDFNRR
ncbi:DUF1800 domain-containing protein [Paracoccus luteus]|uniref:DUF1800 domain-containing protein n=1 Tax=Paracoccus luteus TaxID=2508543 RepID=UPI001FED279F|nr:DUF1800 domain-containing protein [Paracoccus luteus]